MRALPIALAFALAAILAPSLLRALRAAGHVRPNYRGRPLPTPFGVLVPLAGLLALVPLTLLERAAGSDILYPQVLPACAFVLGVALLGLLDDTLPAQGPGAAPRGWRGHTAALLRGQPTTGALKAAGTLGLALLVAERSEPSTGRWLLAAGVLTLATNAFNLLDLRPGRAIKAFVALAAGLTIGANEPRALWTLGLFAGPALVAGIYDVRERAMLGDTGANALGALAGLWLVATLSSAGQLIALACLLAITVYGELRSISALVERLPLLRELDSWGRP
jgi:UDP-GlcNAc:undecaprenyl-phosphate/decaprenyl-phosphate GlcNAc-1-phosphate transferase